MWQSEPTIITKLCVKSKVIDVILMDISGHVMKPNWRYYLHQIEGLCKSYVRGYTDITPKIWLTAHMVQYLRCLKWPLMMLSFGYGMSYYRSKLGSHPQWQDSAWLNTPPLLSFPDRTWRVNCPEELEL